MRLADLAPVKLLLPAIPLVVVAIATPPAPTIERVESPPVVKVEPKPQPAPTPVPVQPPAPAPQPQVVT